MAFSLTPKDLEVLSTIAEYRILGVQHVSVVHQRNPAALRRRLRLMEDKGLIRIATSAYGRGLGRPEGLVSLCEEGVDLLKARRLIDVEIPASHVTAEKIRCLEHHLLTNELRAQLAQLKTITPLLSASFLSPLSPKQYRPSAGWTSVYERFLPSDDSDRWIEFIPDGVFAITNEAAKKAALFFLEVDMATETVASPQPCGIDVRHKVDTYKAFFRRGLYRRYEQVWGCRFRGFRLLFLTCNTSRMATLCRLVREMRPSDFIWLTDQQSLASQGVWAPIWAPGGVIDAPRKSILGSQCPNPSPTPADLG